MKSILFSFVTNVYLFDGGFDGHNRSIYFFWPLGRVSNMVNVWYNWEMSSSEFLRESRFRYMSWSINCRS